MDRAKIIAEIRSRCEASLNESGPADTLAKGILDLMDPDNDAEKIGGVSALFGKLDGLELDRPVVFFDLETTSDNPDNAQIIEIGGVKVFPDGSETVVFRSLVCPGVHITPEIQELTGITNDDLAKAPTWSRVGRAFFEFVKGCDLAGYGIHNFDRIILWNELFRIGIAWDVEECVALDLANLVKKANPRTLSAMVREYLDQDHEGAHRATDDAQATLQIAGAMLARHQEFRGRFHDLALASAMDRRLDLAGKILLDENNVPIYGIGDLRGKPIAEYPEFARWMLGKPFSEQTKGLLRKILAASPEPIRQRGKRH